MFQWVNQFLAVRGLAPHGYCLLWDPALIWTHVISDTVIAAAYFSIPLVLWRLLALRRDIQFGWMVALFAIFILACGLTHVMGIVTLWIPAYGWEALVKVVTAAASLGTALLLIPLLPKLANIPSPAALQKANEALRREASAREQTEAMLWQAQKMEAIGQLTGGVAHDFNNLLGVIIGNLDRALRKGDNNADVKQAIENALVGAERAAKLTSQLLAFARQQPMTLETHDVNAILSNVAEMIAETVGSTIETKLDLTPDLPPATLDKIKLENALFNLAINARDAMEDGGLLTISTDQSGDQLVISIADTGSGMDNETLQRATDPFFTTKPVGSGSGLGLSQVLGTVEQLAGHMKIESEPGTGTRVRLFLPIKCGGEASNDAKDTVG